MHTMKNRVVRVSDETWAAAQAKALEEGTTVSAVIRRLLHAYVKAGAVVLLAVLAFVTLSSCGAEDAPSSPAAERTAVVSAPVVETPSEAVTSPPEVACWQITQAIRDEYNAFLPSPELIAWLDALPDESEGCTPNDAKALRFFANLDVIVLPTTTG